jgi:hypothetical protein
MSKTQSTFAPAANWALKFSVGVFIMIHTLRKWALVTALAITSASSFAALRVSDAFDGAWSNEALAKNQGPVIDFIPLRVPATNQYGILFVSFYTYDAAGAPVWVATNFPIWETEFKWTGKEVFRYTGGQFGGTGTPTGTSYGAIDITFNSCSSLDIAFRPAASTTLQPRNFTGLTRAVPTSKTLCPFTRTFSGCPAGSTAAATDRTCVLSGEILDRSLTLTNETTWVLNGLVRVGKKNANPAAVTVEAGTWITGSGNTADYLYVNPGSKLFVNGTAYAPAVFTSQKDGVSGLTPAPKDWGGVVLSGNAPTNCAGGTCNSEFDPTLQFGGTNTNDSSGVLKYFQVRYAGYVFAPNKEVNSLTLQGTGEGTIIDFFQSYRGGDDGVEMFGGTTNLKHIVLTEGGDDGIDWDLGYSGKIQYALVTNGGGLGEDFGIEGANSPENFDAAPRAVPMVANATFIGGSSIAGNNTRDGIQFKEGSGGRVFNTVVNDYKRACLELNALATFSAVGTLATPTGNSTIQGSFLGTCAAGLYRTTVGATETAPFTADAFYNSQTSNRVGLALMDSTGYLPSSTSPLLSGGVRPTNKAGAVESFFDATTYVGAFRDANDDWTRGWTVGF